jgi:type I restriction enzyme M protein
MLLNSLTGEIAHMNSLTNEFYAGYKVATVLIDGYHYPYYKEITDREESYIWRQGIIKNPQKSPFATPFNPEKSKHVDGVQGNLFEQ